HSVSQGKLPHTQSWVTSRRRIIAKASKHGRVRSRRKQFIQFRGRGAPCCPVQGLAATVAGSLGAAETRRTHSGRLKKAFAQAKKTATVRSVTAGVGRASTPDQQAEKWTTPPLASSTLSRPSRTTYGNSWGLQSTRPSRSWSPRRPRR